MMLSVEEKIDIGNAVFKWVQHTPLRDLKNLDDDELEMLLQHLIKEVREVGRALHWVDGIIKLKSIEREQQPSNPIVPNPIKEVRS